MGEVSSLRVLHNDVQLALRRPVDLLEPHDVVVLQHLQDLRLLHRCLLFLRRQLRQVYLLYYPQLFGRYLLYQEGATVRSSA